MNYSSSNIIEMRQPPFNPPQLSVVIPVYNEETNLPELFRRLTHVLSNMGRTYEIIFVNDGSKDKSSKILETFFHNDPFHVRVVEFTRNAGQHMAIMAGFEQARGLIVMTMDADLQNPPEELPKVFLLTEEGHDYVGSYRLKRHDSWFRTYASRLVNWARGHMTSIKMSDHGCMMRAYSQDIVSCVLECNETSTLVPVLAYTFAQNPTEVGIEHVSRQGDTSKYTLYKLFRLNFDLVTGFSSVPLHMLTILGLVSSFLTGLLVVYMVLRRLWLGPEAEGVFTLFAIVFFLISIVLTGVGLLGEYVGRIYDVVRERPRYRIKRILERNEDLK